MIYEEDVADHYFSIDIDEMDLPCGSYLSGDFRLNLRLDSGCLTLLTVEVMGPMGIGYVSASAAVAALAREWLAVEANAQGVIECELENMPLPRQRRAS